MRKVIVAELFKLGAVYPMVTSEPACTEVGVEVKPRPLDWAAAIAADVAKATKLKKRILICYYCVIQLKMRSLKLLIVSDYATVMAR